MNPGNSRTRIHINLYSLFVEKNSIDKLVFGLFKYASGKGYPPPYMFTANVNTDDLSYLGALKNNNVCLLDGPIDADILFDISWKKALPQLLIIPNMPVSYKCPGRSCIYIDWDNIQVSHDNIKQFIQGISTFIHNIKMHRQYVTYVFLHNKVSEITKSELRAHHVHIIIIIKDKANSGDAEMLGYIRKNTMPSDSICVASGDRDFSSLLVEYVHLSHNVFLVYNTQAIFTFKHNHHWLGTIDCREFITPKVKADYRKQQSLGVSNKNGTKPCKFYNLDICKSVVCSFLHICGVCGRPHKTQDFHPGITIMKNSVCKKYNKGVCPCSPLTCDHLHICSKCKYPHPYIQCKLIVMHCPLCNVTMHSSVEYIRHHMETLHIERMSTISKIINPKSSHVMVI